MAGQFTCTTSNFSEVIEFIKQRFKRSGISPITFYEDAYIMGSSITKLPTNFVEDVAIDYGDLPGFHVPTAPGHEGCMHFGRLKPPDSSDYSGNSVDDIPVIIMMGRFHYYEGYQPHEVVEYVYLLHLLGVRSIFLSNACGSCTHEIPTGDIIVIRDHINTLPNPLRGIAAPFDERFVDMKHCYDKEYRNLIQSRIGIVFPSTVRQGVYMSLPGPSFETFAEYNACRILGADVVGMSTTPEVIRARSLGMRVFAVAVVTDEGTSSETTFKDYLNSPLNESNQYLIYDIFYTILTRRSSY